MQTLSTASPEEQAVVLKAAEARYQELGIPVETAAILFQDEIAKIAEEMLGQMEKEGQLVQPLVRGASTAGNTMRDFWEALPPMARQGLINALIGGGIGGLGGAGYGLLQGQEPGPLAAQGAGFGALAGALTPALGSLVEKFSEDLDGAFNSLTKSALEQMTAVGFPEADAEQILLLQLQKVAVSLGAYASKMDNKAVTLPKPTDSKGPKAKKPPTPKTMPRTGEKEVAPKTMPRTGEKEVAPKTMPIKQSCDADKGDYHANPAGAYPLQVFSDIKKKVNKTNKQRKIKKIAADLTEAVKAARCGTAHGKAKTKTKTKAKKKEVKE